MRIPLWNRSVWALFLCTFFSIFAQFTNHSFRYLHFRSYFGVMCLFIAANSVSVFSFCPVVLRLQVQSWDTTRFTLREFFKFLSDYLFWNYMSCVYSAWYHLESEVFSFWVTVFYFVYFAFLLFTAFVQLGSFIFYIGIRFVSPLGLFSFLINGITHPFLWLLTMSSNSVVKCCMCWDVVGCVLSVHLLTGLGFTCSTGHFS